jgi:pantoate--beta-alanine ligase
MQIAYTVEEAKKITRSWKREGQTIGLVPTMGYLHEGHASLIRKARENNDKVVVSVFLNPIQFAPNEDLDSYPRDFEHDCALAEEMGADLVFHPEPSEMYKNHETYVNMGLLTESMDGLARPIHFRGVCTVLTKLFNIMLPDNAYFGQKDAQQLAIVKKMVFDLNFDVKITGCPIVREDDGLAKSSRNTYLSPEERAAAPVLSRSIAEGERVIEAGMASADLVDAMMKVLDAEPLADTEYVKVVDALTMQPVETIDRPVLVAMAVHVGPTRLIDNFSWDPEDGE